MSEPSGAPGPTGVLFPELLAATEPAPPAQPRGVLFPELLAATEPAPLARPRGARLLHGLARVLLWSLITVGAVRDCCQTLRVQRQRARPLGPIRDGTIGAPERDRAAAWRQHFCASTTVGEDGARPSAPPAHRARVDRAFGRGPTGLDQYPTSSCRRQQAGHRGVEVTVVAHVLQAGPGGYRDGGTLAFVVPLAVQPEGIGVAGHPRPTAVPVGARLALPRSRAVPPSMSRLAGRVAHQAVVALITGDEVALARLGGGRPPSTRQLPSGWRAVSVGPAVVTGPPGALAAQVPVRARPPAGPVSYSLPVHVQLTNGPRGITVRQVDGGGSP